MAEVQGDEFATFIRKELEYEHARRDAVNTRAATAIASSTGFVTIVLAVVAIAKGKDFTLAGWDLTVLIAALVLLLAAAVCAIVAGFNHKYEVTDYATLVGMLNQHWTDDEVDARHETARLNVETIKSLRLGTNIKTAFYIASTILQALAILVLGITVIMIVT